MSTTSQSRKQQIYLEIFSRVLPLLRNLESQSAWKRIRFGTLFPEAELVHNLPPLLLDREIRKVDVWWLKSQGKQYRKAHAKSKRPLGDEIVSFLTELEKLIPPDLRSEFDANPDLNGLSFLKT